ncbi:hypothetical protein DFQ30_007908 [Apophysomyces sp. BC1015]|nr:hypothetical protein DFQ30_007908 [Apophysomyces sp. BC1015]KAG0176390.1 hypothetical protein DFQ29_006193 [Apophysomyces sp. BC1021]
MSNPQRTAGYTPAPRGYTPGNRPAPPTHRHPPPSDAGFRRPPPHGSPDNRGPMHSEIRGERRRSREYLYQHPSHAPRHQPNDPYGPGYAVIGRSRSLTRPERQRPRPGLIRAPSRTRPPQAHPSMMPARAPNQPMSNRLQQQLQEQKLAQQQQLHQAALPPHPIEELTLCYIVLLLCGALAFITYGLNKTICPRNQVRYPYASMVDGVRKPIYYDEVRVFGQIFPFEAASQFFASKGLNFTKDYANMEIGSIFDGDTNNACSQYNTASTASISPELSSCRLDSPYGGGLSLPNGQCLSLAELQRAHPSDAYLGFQWADLRPVSTVLGNTNLVLVGNSVLNLTRYFEINNAIYGEAVDRTLRSALGQDASYAVMYNQQARDARHCLVARYAVGAVDIEPGGCIADQIIMNLMFALIISVIVIRYLMALLFQWFIARRLVKPGGRSNWLAWRSIKGGNDDPANHIPGPYNNYGPMAAGQNSLASLGSQNESNPRIGGGSVRSDIVQAELYTLMLVTCYSEGEEGLRITMDSLAETTYSNKHKIFFVIADGMITGAGETKSTPDIVVDMMDLDPTMANPLPKSYLAVADGEKQLNMAKVYAGHYKGVPCITVVKCGTEEEASGPKPGNRGKRDSQLILMSFFQRVLFNDRLSELDYEMFWKMTWLMKGVTPDKFELVLMVDADTKVLPAALTYMVAAMANDITIMGLCGETRIANKRTSWVTAIQVFEYYISHHYVKAFESLFGMVTCLPGCFSMYRIKSPKNGAWVPILANPDIVLEYNQNVVTTLHEKNLLLLGEDRFLSTLMLRTFPKRQMMFVPQARCRTVVPDEFMVLLSQRRRWINSTVHNLMELVLVSDLCGIACLSMQFSVFIDLVFTMVLPAAIVMTIYLIVQSAVVGNPQWQSIGLLLAILGLPGVLIAITTFKIVYVLWMIIYIIALPIWNLVLPLYSFWHFDDFSWGATRVVVGEKKGASHGDAEGKFDSSRLVMKKWEDWESERTGQNFNRSRVTLMTPPDRHSAFDGSVNLNPSSSPAFGNIFNDRKMFGSTPSLNKMSDNV